MGNEDTVRQLEVLNNTHIIIYLTIFTILYNPIVVLPSQTALFWQENDPEQFMIFCLLDICLSNN